MLTVKGIVVRTIKYGETSLILDLFTEEKGLISCIAGGIRKKRSTMPPAAFQLLQVIKATIYFKDNERLSRIKEVQPLALHHQLIDDPVKRVIVLFLAELLQKSVKEKEAREDLFHFLTTQLAHLNNLTDHIANFHLLFMLELSRYLGFYPIQNYNEDFVYFDVIDGQFVMKPDARRTLSDEESRELNKLFALSIDDLSIANLSNNDRRSILQSMIKYYQSHIEGFGEMKSPKIIHVVLS